MPDQILARQRDDSSLFRYRSTGNRRSDGSISVESSAGACAAEYFTIQR
jgi:hypothetical protein